MLAFCHVGDGLAILRRPSSLRHDTASNHVDSVRQLIATGLGTRKVLLEHACAPVDRHDKALGDAAAAHVGGECVDSSLPLRLWHACRYALVGDDAGIALRQGDEDQNAGAILLAPYATDHELLHGRA